MRPLSSSTTWNSCGPSPSVTPVQSDVYGFIRSPVEERGSSWRKTSRSAKRGRSFSIPSTVTSTGGSVVHMRPFPSDSTTQTAPGLGDAEVRAADADPRGEESLAQVDARRLGEVARVVGRDARRDRAREEVADLGAVAVDRRDEDVRRPVAVELEDQLGEVRLERVDARVGERVVEPDLVRRQRLDLHDLVDAVRARDVDDDGVRLGGVARPVHVPARRLDGRLELEEVRRRGARARRP